MPKHESRVAGSERRRSQRIPVTKSLVVGWDKGDGIYVRKKARTENVSGHGALLRLEHTLPLHMIVALDHAGSATVARVVRCEPPKAEGWAPVAVELAYPSQAFWGTLFWSGL